MAKQKNKVKSKLQKDELPKSLFLGVAGFILVLALLLGLLAYSKKIQDEGQSTPPPPPAEQKQDKPEKLKVIRDPKDKRLIKWIQKNGGYIADFLSIRAGKYGRGVFTEKAVNKNDKLYKIPDNLWFSEGNVVTKKCQFHKIARDPRAAVLMGHEKLKLSVAIEAERNAVKGFWRPYIDTLPKSPSEFPGQPLFWKESQLPHIQSRIVLSQLNNSHTWLDSQFDTIITPMVEAYPDIFPSTTRETFKIAYYNVLSRVFDVGDPSDDNDHTSGMLPFVDLANHASETIVENNNQIERQLPAMINSYQVLAYDHLEAGSEILQTYQSYPSCISYLYTYGFLPADITDNEKDFLWIDGGPLPSNSKLRLVPGTGIVQDGFIKSLNMASDEAFQLILKSVREVIALHPTTLEEDLEQYHANEDSAMFISLNIRVRFKQILAKMLETLTAKQSAPYANPEIEYLHKGTSLEYLELPLDDSTLT
eukprot:m.7831 g.7831  ORF g.7831 m.7831 type:complete len:478 (+) comp3785_c0_seq1:163-1596(+)